MADEKQGEVVIQVDVDSKGFDKGTIDLEKAIKSLEDTMNKAVESMSKSISETLTAALKNLDGQIEMTGQKAKETASKSQSGSYSKGKYTEEYKELADFVNQQEKNLERLREQQKIYDEIGFSKDKQYAYNGFTQKDNPLGEPSEYKNLQEQINNYAQAVKNAKEKMKELEQSGKKFALTLSQELSKAAHDVSNINFKPLDLSQYDVSVQRYVANLNKANLEYAQQSDLLKQLETQLAFLSTKEQTSEVVSKSNEIQGRIETLKVKLQQLEFNARTAQSTLETALNPPVTLSQELDRIANEVSHIDFSPLDVSQYNDSVQQYAANVNKANLEYAKQEDILRQLQAQLDFLRKQEQTPETENKITELENKIQELMVKLQQLGLNAQNAQNQFDAAMVGLGESIAAETQAVNGGLSNIIGYFRQLELFPPVVKRIGSGVLRVARGFRNICSGISKAVSNLNIFNSCQAKSEDMSKKLVKQFTRIFTMVKSRVVRTFVSSLFSGITEGIKELAKADDNFNKRISELKSKFLQLKFAIMSAFAPLISYAAPIITKAITYINSLVDKIGQLMAALTGQGTYQKAKYNYEDYAKSLEDAKKSTDKTKKSTDDLTDSAKELNKQLASFDKLNVFNNDSDNGTSDTLLDDTALNEPVYTEVPVSFEIGDLAKRIKEAFANGDFTGLGEELGNKLNEQIKKIDPEKIGETIAKRINSASSFAIGFLTSVEWGELTEKITSNLNTLIENIDTEQLGEAFAEAINTVFEIGFTFADTFDWEKFGTKIADFVNSIFENTDWEKVGKTINGFIIGILDMILSFVDNLNGDEVGESVGKAIKEIDIVGIAVRLAKILWGVIKLTWKIIKGLWDGSGILSWWEEQGEKWGKGISEKFIVPFKDLIRDIKKTLKDGNWRQFLLDVFVAPIDIILNAIIDLINRISFNIPDFVPYWGGTHVGFDIPHIPMPKLATGTVVPANYGEFAAILGDNKREPEVVSPISAIEQAVENVLNRRGITSGFDGDIVIPVEIDSREVFRAVKRQNDAEKRRHGGRSQLA